MVSRWASRFGLLSLLACSVTVNAHSEVAADQWSAIDQMITDFVNVTDMSFTAGDISGRKHTFTKGKITMNTPLLMASSSKFPAVLAIARAIAAGHLSFDTKVNEVFPWWTSDPADKRSRVELKHLLSFTSGMVTSSVDGGNISCLGILKGFLYSSEGCAKEIYHQQPFEAEPGQIWSYNSLHLQVAAAMAAKATKLPLQIFLHRFVLAPLNMTRSFWVGLANPHVAATLVSRGEDYDNLLWKYLSYEAVPKDIADVLEKDWTAPPVKPGNNTKDKMLLNIFGHYSMGLYYECVANTTLAAADGESQVGWSKECADRLRHSDPGAFGYWPLIDRKKNFYMQLVTQFTVPVPKGTDPSIAAGLPAKTIAPLRFALQHPVERALNKSAKLSSAAEDVDLDRLTEYIQPMLSNHEFTAMQAVADAYNLVTV